MKKYSDGRGQKEHRGNGMVLILTALLLAGCGEQKADGAVIQEPSADEAIEAKEEADDSVERRTETEDMQTAGFAGESARDARIDVQALQAENPDVFGWLYIPGTAIDDPVLQSGQADDYYESHNAYGQKDEDGAVYIELANLTSMCDFNTVLHGRTGAEATGPFADLYRFADPDFFSEHEKAYLYLDGNVLTYEIFAAYERENTSLLRCYDFTYFDGCERFLDDLYGIRDMTMNLRKGWEGITPYHFLITLTTQREEDADRQFVVIAILTEDAAGTIDRVVAE